MTSANGRLLACSPLVRVNCKVNTPHDYQSQMLNFPAETHLNRTMRYVYFSRLYEHCNASTTLHKHFYKVTSRCGRITSWVKSRVPQRQYTMLRTLCNILKGHSDNFTHKGQFICHKEYYLICENQVVLCLLWLWRELYKVKKTKLENYISGSV